MADSLVFSSSFVVLMNKTNAITNIMNILIVPSVSLRFINMTYILVL